MQRRIIERFSFHELKSDTTVSKETRIKSLVPLMENGKIFLNPERTEGILTLIHEIQRFPKGRTDDCLDALAWVTQVATTPQGETVLPAQTYWGRIIEERNNRNRYGRGVAPVGSRVRRGVIWPRG
jgi:hypothetical protein